MQSGTWQALFLLTLLLACQPSRLQGCAHPNTECSHTRCCLWGWQCYQKHPGYGECLQACSPDQRPGWDCHLLYPWQLQCPPKGAACTRHGCCRDPELACYSLNATYAKCVEAYEVHGSSGWPSYSPPPPFNALPQYLSPEDFGGAKWWTKAGHQCHSRFVPPEPPLHATDLNGQQLPDVCFNGTGPHHVFLIGDWGGILPGHKGNEVAGKVKPADHTPFGEHKRGRKLADNDAQQRVADVMRDRAAVSQPDYVINVGDAFYWGGVETHCGLPPFQHTNTDQWRVIFEDMYKGEGLDGKQWLGVLGNHDYGGWMFTGGWDQTIGYTWARGPGSTKRWILPAQYWRVTVHYDDFKVDYYFADSNVFDTMAPTNPSFHNICNMEKSGGSSASCGPQGPVSPWDCPQWFKKLWQDQMDWFEGVLPKSTAEWKIIVTHFPPTWGCDDWVRIARKHSINLFITGHKHSQEVHYMEPFGWEVEGWPIKSNFLDPTAWIVTGGGGGVTSQHYPDDHGHDDAYGFVDLELKKDEIIVEMVSHGGFVRQRREIHRWLASIPTPDPKDRTAEGNQASRDAGCGNKAHTFYVYRAQNDKDYIPENINAASLPGVLYYLHHEVVIVCPRKFGITRIKRMKVTVKNTCDLAKAKQTHFGPYVPFDSGRCDIGGCEDIWKDYGPVVGCQHIPFNTGVFAAYCRKPDGLGVVGTFEHCQYAQWFSFPGPCPSQPYWQKTKECVHNMPGGLCKTSNVTGERDCTYHFEEAGEVYLDELYDQPIGNWNSFCSWGMEYNNKTDSGTVNFWDGIYNPLQGQRRIAAVRALFKKRYPHLPEYLGDAECDYYETDPKDYLFRTGSGFQRYPGSANGIWMV